MVYAQPGNRSGKRYPVNLLGILDTSESLSLGYTMRLKKKQQKNMRELAELWTLLSRLITVKLKESEKKLLGLARELKIYGTWK